MDQDTWFVFNHFQLEKKNNTSESRSHNAWDESQPETFDVFSEFWGV